MATSRAYDPKNRDEVFDTLRREILAARVKVDLDDALKRPTSETVKRLAGMKLPPVVQPRHDNARHGIRVFTDETHDDLYEVVINGVSLADRPAHQGYAKQ